MVETIEAVYENGVFRPLTPVNGALKEGQHVNVSFKADDLEQSHLGRITGLHTQNWLN